MDEEGITDYKEFQDDDEKNERFDSGIIWYDSVYEGVKFASLENSLLKAIETEMKKECNHDEVKALDEKKLNALIKKVNEKIRQIAPRTKATAPQR